MLEAFWDWSHLPAEVMLQLTTTTGGNGVEVGPSTVEMNRIAAEFKIADDAELGYRNLVITDADGQQLELVENVIEVVEPAVVGRPPSPRPPGRPQPPIERPGRSTSGEAPPAKEAAAAKKASTKKRAAKKRKT
jgi:hypothetical protein